MVNLVYLLAFTCCAALLIQGYKNIWLPWSRQFVIEIIFHHEVEIKIFHCLDGTYKVHIVREKEHLTEQDFTDAVRLEICYKYGLEATDDTVSEVVTLITHLIQGSNYIDVFLDKYTGSTIDLRDHQERSFHRQSEAITL